MRKMIHKPGYIQKIRKNPQYYCRKCGIEQNVYLKLDDSNDQYTSQELYCNVCNSFILELDPIPTHRR